MNSGNGKYWHSRPMGRLHRLRVGRAGPRSRRLPSRCPPAQRSRGARLDGRLDLARAAFQPRRLFLVRVGSGSRVSDRLRDREGALGRQYLRLHCHFLRLLGSAEIPAPRAILGSSRRTDHARDFHRARRSVAPSVPLGGLPVRSVPCLHRGQTPDATRQRNRPRKESNLPVVPTPDSLEGRLRNRTLHRRRCRHSFRDTFAPGYRRHRGYRHRFRSRLDPRDLRGHDRSLHRVHLEHLRYARVAGALLRTGGHDGEVPLPQGRSVARVGRRRREDATCRRVQGPDPAVSGRYWDAACEFSRGITALAIEEAGTAHSAYSSRVFRPGCRGITVTDQDEGRGSTASVASSSLRFARKVAVAVIGSTGLALGIALIVLPGPAFIVIPLGLAILATEFLWARRLLRRVRQGAASAYQGVRGN